MAASPSLHYSFTGKRVLVTGGGRGIGKTIVQRFYSDGAHLFVIDKDQSLLEALRQDLPLVKTIHLDLSDWNATKAAVEEIGPLDHLVNNAAINCESFLLDVTSELCDSIFNVNWKAALNVSQAFVNGILGQDNTASNRTIVNITSIADRTVFPKFAVYSSMKAALTMLSKCMAEEFGQYGIRVNCVCPAYVPTELTLQIDPGVLEEALKIYRTRAMLKHRQVQTADVADAVLFLSSPFTSMITGESLVIDAGYLAN